MIIQDIDAEWCHTLATRYPKSLDMKFLAKHVLRLGDIGATYEKQNGFGDEYSSLHDEYEALIEEVDTNLTQAIMSTKVCEGGRGCHIDGQMYGATSRYLEGMKVLYPIRRYRTESFME